MYALLCRKGSKNYSCTYSAVTDISDTNQYDWYDGDSPTSNGMNDEISSVTTGANTWVWLFEDTNYGTTGETLLVSPNNSNFDVHDNGFSAKLGSFQVCDSDPTLVATPPATIPNYVSYKNFPIPSPSKTNLQYQKYALYAATSVDNYVPLSGSNDVLSLDNSSSISTIPTTQNIGSSLALSSQWQFFEVSSGNYVIANCESGKLLYKTSTSVTINSAAGIEMTLGNNTDLCGVYALTQWLDENKTPSTAIAIRDLTGAGNTFLTPNSTSVDEVVGDQYSNAVWYLVPYDTPVELLGLTPGSQTMPSYDNGMAPLVSPAIPLPSNAAYVPYFMVNDKTMQNWSNRIQNSPYYQLIQYSQYKLAASVMNNTDGVDTFNESWTYGWSAELSASVSADLGFTLGDDFDVNIIIIKDTIEASLNASLGISFSGSISGSGSYSKDLSINVPAQSCGALYGVETTYELYQMDGVSCVAKPNVPMRMDNNFLTIQGALPS